jgi:hypothetical protein
MDGMADKILLRFLQSHGCYFPGDTAGFEPRKVKELLGANRGGQPIVIRVTPESLAEEKATATRAAEAAKHKMAEEDAEVRKELDKVHPPKPAPKPPKRRPRKK